MVWKYVVGGADNSCLKPSNQSQYMTRVRVSGASLQSDIEPGDLMQRVN